MNNINPISIQEFNLVAKNEHSLEIDNYEIFFAREIAEAANFAIGSYFWFIGNNNEMKIVAASQNIGTLTPFSHNEWSNGTSIFFIENLHPDDIPYVLSALNLAVKKIEELPKDRHSDFRVNIYARMLNNESKFRWVLIQMPKLHIDQKTQSNCALMMVTDLSHFSFLEKPVLMTLTDKVLNQNIYYNIANDKTELISIDLPNITKREREVLQLMAKGLKSPEIATKLFLSYHTIENHKRNLRQKTNSKTSVELINYVWQNNLL